MAPRSTATDRSAQAFWFIDLDADAYEWLHLDDYSYLKVVPDESRPSRPAGSATAKIKAAAKSTVPEAGRALSKAGIALQYALRAVRANLASIATGSRIACYTKGRFTKTGTVISDVDKAEHVFRIAWDKELSIAIVPATPKPGVPKSPGRRSTAPYSNIKGSKSRNDDRRAADLFDFDSNPADEDRGAAEVSGDHADWHPLKHSNSFEPDETLKPSLPLFQIQDAAPAGSAVLVDRSKLPASKAKEWEEVTLAYGTNRVVDNPENPNTYYGFGDGALQYGLCKVSIPAKGRKKGEIPRPAEWWFIKRAEKASKHVVLNEVAPMSRKAFRDWVRTAADRPGDKAAIVFIHGFNVTFAEAAYRTAQLAYDLTFDGLVSFFSWPSAGAAGSYAADIERADLSAPALGQFLKDLLKDSGIQRLHLIAHSMGNRTLTIALNALVSDPGFAPHLEVLDQIVLAAPDLDQKVFVNTLLPAFQKLGKNRTIYATEHDNALRISRFIRGGMPRLGDCGKQIFVAAGIDTVDASEVPSPDIHHSYVFDTHRLLMDLYLLLVRRLKPGDRSLQRVPAASSQFWRFLA